MLPSHEVPSEREEHQQCRAVLETGSGFGSLADGVAGPAHHDLRVHQDVL